MHCRRRAVNETITVERIEQHLAFNSIQGQRRAWTCHTRAMRPHHGLAVCAYALALGRTAPQAHGFAGGASTQHWCEFMYAGHQVLQCLLSVESSPSRAATFFWTSMTNWAFTS